MLLKILFIMVNLGLSALGQEDMQSIGLRSDKDVNDEFSSSEYKRVGDMIVPVRRPETRAGYDYFPNWPKKTVPYVISENVTDELRALIPEAIDHLNTYTCIKFRPMNKKTDKAWIRFMMDPELIENPDSSVACSAVMGYMGSRDQAVLIGDKCTKGPLIHELLHTLGLSHEHQRNDRDEYIRVHWENMEDESDYITDEEDCKKMTEDSGDSSDCKFSYHNVNYNYDSIMHYCNRCGSKNGKKVFSTLNNPDALGKPENTGQVFGLSEGDWLLINRKYGCNPDDNPSIPKPPPIPDNPPKSDQDKKRPPGCKKRTSK